MVIFNFFWLFIKLIEFLFFFWLEGEVFRGVLLVFRDVGGVIWFFGGGGGVILWIVGEWLIILFLFVVIVGGVGFWLCIGYKGGVMWFIGGWYGNDGGGVIWFNGGMDGWGRRGLVVVVKGGVIGWNICGELWLLWWLFKWLFIFVVERMLCNGVVFIGLKLWFLRLNRGCLRFFERLFVDLVWIVGEFKVCEEFIVVWLVFDVVVLVNEGVDMFFVNIVGIDGVFRKLFIIGVVVVIGGGGVKRGCVKLLRFRLVIFENKIKIFDSYSFFYVNLKNMVGYR